MCEVAFYLKVFDAVHYALVWDEHKQGSFFWFGIRYLGDNNQGREPLQVETHSFLSSVFDVVLHIIMYIIFQREQKL